MFDFRSPSITAATPEAQMAQLVDYINQLLEALGFAFEEASRGEVSVTDAQLEQIKRRLDASALSISDVVGSYAFKQAVSSQSVPDFKVNYDTGNLEYYFREGD